MPSCGLASRRQTPIAMSSMAAAGDLATYQLPHHSSVASSRLAPWFTGAIREVVRHLESSPFLELVRFGSEESREPKFSSFAVSDSVVGAPELWASIAETVSSDTADVVILVQRVDNNPSAEHAQRCNSREMRKHVEDACRKLVACGVGEAILAGSVGDCCDEDEAPTKSSGSSTLRSSIVPFQTGPSTTRKAVKVTALPSGGTGMTPLSGYWGVVVQSRQHTGAEGCYLLKAVRTVPSSGSGCTCTHFSLTRVCQGERLERQFVQSWLV